MKQPRKKAATPAAPAKSNRPRARTGAQSRAPKNGPHEDMRIAKAMARAGLCSRRDAERWIADGRVKVNGKTLETPATVVGPKDRIIVDGRPLPQAEPVRLWRYHKPRGLVTTHKDPQRRPTVFANLPDDLPRVVSVGRLDFNTEGLLLLTNDGELARHLELPQTGWLRRYKVRAYGRVTAQDLEALKDGIEVDGIAYGPINAAIDSVQGGNSWLSVALREGKNREVRKILEHLNLKVNRLIRISYGPFQLRDLDPGAIDPVRRKVLTDQLPTPVKHQLGLRDTSETTGARTKQNKPTRNRRPTHNEAGD